MKNSVSVTFVAVLLGLMISSSTAVMADTYENLYAAVQGETNANAAYNAFAAQAQFEGYPVIARLFLATADAEAKHADDEWAVLVSMGATDRPVAATPTVGSTAENLLTAFNGETYEYTVMYPEFLATALAENISAAVTIFNRAMRAEEVHAGNYFDVLANLGNDDYINGKYAVVYRCPTCGEVVTTLPGRCPICGESGANFVAYYAQLDYAFPEAWVTKLNGNKNNLTITVTEVYDDGTTTDVTAFFEIANNAAGTYKVGSYKVYVDTKGNIQVRACYIVE